MKRYFVSYMYKTKNGTGYAFAGVDRKKGIFSSQDIISVRDCLKGVIKNDLKIDDDINVVILNWRKYDFSLSLWIKDIFNKIRGRK